MFNLQFKLISSNLVSTDSLLKPNLGFTSNAIKSCIKFFALIEFCQLKLFFLWLYLLVKTLQLSQSTKWQVKLNLLIVLSASTATVKLNLMCQILYDTDIAVF